MPRRRRDAYCQSIRDTGSGVFRISKLKVFEVDAAVELGIGSVRSVKVDRPDMLVILNGSFDYIAVGLIPGQDSSESPSVVAP